jgi:hypothetical protein
MLTRITFLTLACLGLFTGGCTHVAPYERGALAHPTMSTAAFDGPASGHVLAVHEGATGGSTGATSGCGCN